MIAVGDHWQTGPWRSEPREIVVEKVVTEGYEEIHFRFLDTEQRSSTTQSAFLRTYVEVPS